MSNRNRTLTTGAFSGEEAPQPWIIVCPGSHPPSWTANWHQSLQAIAPTLAQMLHIAPSHLPWAGYPLRQWLTALIAPPAAMVQDLPSTQMDAVNPVIHPVIYPVIYIVAFSAGCVAAEAIAHYAPYGGYQIGAIFAWDGWGVPLVGPFPVHRLSHDAFTHATSYRPRGTAGDRPHFYGDPAVGHGHLWQAPHQVQGWQVGTFAPQGGTSPQRTTALAFQLSCFHHYGLLATDPAGPP